MLRQLTLLRNGMTLKEQNEREPAEETQAELETSGNALGIAAQLWCARSLPVYAYTACKPCTVPVPPRPAPSECGWATAPLVTMPHQSKL